MKLTVIVIVVSVWAIALVLLVVIFSLGPHFDQFEEEEPRSRCTDEKRNRLTSWTRGNEVRGCEDIYTSVCDNYSKTHELQMSAEIFANQKLKILKVLNGPSDLEPSRAVSILKELYSNCQEPSPAEDDLNRMLKIFSESGGFPVLEGDKFNESEWSWLGMIRKLRSLGLVTDSLFTTTLGFNPLDLRNVTVHIENPRLDLAQKDYCEKGHDCMVSFVYEFLEVVTQFGAAREAAVRDGIELYVLEKKLLNSIWDNPNTSKESHLGDKTTSLSNLSSSFGFVNWTEYLKVFLGSREYLKGDLLVVVKNPGYLRNLQQVLEDTPKRVLANFVIWSVLLQILEYIHGKRRNSVYCYNFLQSRMSYALQSVYARTIHPVDTRTEVVVLEIAGRIKAELLRQVSYSEWMSVETKKEVFEKVEKMEIKVGYPQILLNSTFIDEYYRDLSISDNSLESMLAIRKFHADKYFGLCCGRVEQVFWDLSVDAFLPMVCYETAHSSIHVLQGALEDPIFNVERSMAENLGILGSMIAHEMVHAVDTVGYRYGIDGKRIALSDDPYSVEFDKRSQCFVDQYNSFMEFTEDVLLQSPEISGEFKKLEIVADSIAANLSFQALKTYEQALHRFDDIFTAQNCNSPTPEQMFFLSFAQFYCVKVFGGDLSEEILDEHAPNSYRVIGPFSNLDSFENIFHCNFESKFRSGGKCTMF